MARLIHMSILAAGLCLASCAHLSEAKGASRDTVATHPRLYFTPAELQKLRSLRKTGFHAVMYQNLITSADWCLARPLRRMWIAPVSPDPIYENLYDRFYAMMQDMAVMEHLAFAWAYSEEPRYLEGAKAWMLTSARIWQREADGAADAGKAYAVLRLLKGVATAYDILHEKMNDEERAEIQGILVQVGHKYYQWYLDHPTMGTIEQGPHHASVEAASFGIAALALLDEVPESKEWLALMVKKHRESLLPSGIADDGAQIEGGTFWASTMQYRLGFMDALRRITGEDLFNAFARDMDGRFAMACIAATKTEVHDQDHETVILEPSYGQINYFAPVLVALAREYRKPLCQHLAQWDKTLGSLQQTRYVTTNGEQLLFDWGGNAYAWYDPTVRSEVEPDAPLSFTFPSVNEAYLRTSYEPNGIVVGMRRNQVVIHAGGRPIYVDHYSEQHPNPPAVVRELNLEDDGEQARLTCQGDANSGFTHQTIVLQRPATLTFTRDTTTEQRWWCYGKPVRDGNTLRWKDGTTLKVTQGSLISLTADGYHDEKVVGMGKLKLVDPLPKTYPLIKAKPLNGKLVLEVTSACAAL